MSNYKYRICHEKKFWFELLPNNNNTEPVASSSLYDTYVEKDVGEICVLFSSKVYWIPIDSDEFKHVMKWRRDVVIESGGVRSAKSIDWNIENYFVCERHYESKGGLVYDNKKSRRSLSN